MKKGKKVAWTSPWNSLPMDVKVSEKPIYFHPKSGPNVALPPGPTVALPLGPTVAPPPCPSVAILQKSGPSVAIQKSGPSVAIQKSGPSVAIQKSGPSVGSHIPSEGLKVFAERMISKAENILGRKFLRNFTPADGNCFYYAIIDSLKSLDLMKNQSFSNHIELRRKMAAEVRLF